MSFQIHKNKKGFVASVLVDMFAFLAFALIVLIFFFLFKFKAETVKSTIDTASEIKLLDANPILLNYLRSTTTLDSEAITIADLIIMYKLDKDKYKQKLDQETHEFIDNLNKLYKDKLIDFSFVVQEPSYSYITSRLTIGRYNEESIIIPFPEGDIKVTLIMHSIRKWKKTKKR